MPNPKPILCEYCGWRIGSGVGKTGVVRVWGKIACDDCWLDSLRKAAKRPRARQAR